VVPRKGYREDRFRIDAPLKEEIPTKTVFTHEEKKNQIIVTAERMVTATNRNASVEKVLSVLKKFIITHS
jgi:hypothetical protein